MRAHEGLAEVLTQSSAWSPCWTSHPHEYFCHLRLDPVGLGCGVQGGLLVRPAMVSGWYERYDQGHRALSGQDGPADRHMNVNHDGGVASCNCTARPVADSPGIAQARMSS